jgi:flagellar basal-body rod protein FlgB
MLIQRSLFSQTSLPLLGKSLDASALRSKAIAANLANVATPGYERIEVSFEDAMRQALNPKPIRPGEDSANAMKTSPDPAQVEPIAFRPIDVTKPSGLNNVDIDLEMAKLAENQLAFHFGVHFVQDRRGAIESAIRGSAA